MRKCAQCGNDIPAGNTCCTHCGYNANEVNRKSSYSFGKTTNFQIGKSANTNANSKVGKIILIVFLIMFFGPFFLAILLMVVFAILFATGVFDDSSEMDCPTYCEGEYTYVGDQCYCDDGNVYDEYDSTQNNVNDSYINSIDDNVHIYENNSINLDRYVNNNVDVVVIVCSDFASTCSQYANRMIDIAQRDNFNLFVYKYELLNEENKDSILKYCLGIYDEFKPLTFIISGGNMKSYHQEDMIRNEIEDYLITNGII